MKVQAQRLSWSRVSEPRIYVKFDSQPSGPVTILVLLLNKKVK
jgi:hypothetical protein